MRPLIRSTCFYLVTCLSPQDGGEGNARSEEATVGNHIMKMLLVVILATTLTRVSSTSMCDACECIGLEQLKLINCSSRSLHHNFPNETQWPMDARSQEDVQVSVSLEKNRITRVEQFPFLPRVMRLSLAHNTILDIATHAFVKLNSLTHLDLSYNHLSGDAVRADVLRGSYRKEEYEPMSLISLNLAYNYIHSLGRKTFEHLPFLQELYLSGNPLKLIDAPTTATLGYPKALKILDLSATGLSELSDEFVHLPSLKNHLKVLILSANNFTEVPEELASLGSSLLELNLNGNPLLELGEGSLLGLRRLRVLSISGMPHLRRIGPAAFDELDNLTALYAAHNPHLSDIDEAAFRQLRTLKELHLEHCALDWLQEKMLPWEDLEVIDIQSNPWLCDCDLQWMTAKLVPFLATADPEHVVDLHCASPQWLAGVSLLTLSQHPDEGRGPLCEPEPREPAVKRRPRPRSLAATLLLATAVCMCSVAAITACFICYRRLKVLKPVVLGTVVYVPVREEAKY